MSLFSISTTQLTSAIMTIQSFASTRFISFIRVYILIPTKQVAKAVNTTLTIKPCAPRADIKMPSLSRLKIASRMYNSSIVNRSCGFGKNEGMATPQREDCPGEQSSDPINRRS